MTTPVTAVEISENKKLGPISATYVSQASCPNDCPWYGAGCYAESGVMGYTTQRLNRSTERDAVAIARAEADAIDGLSGERLLRLHVVGDTRTNRGAERIGSAAKRYAQRGMKPVKGKKVFGYSHAWKRVKRESWGEWVSMLASCETVADAKRAMTEGYAAALVVAEFERDSAYEMEGVTVLPCPAQTRDGVTCATCGLCRDDDRLREAGLVIAFAAHGAAKGKVKRKLISLQMV